MKEQDLINALLRSDFNSFLYRCMLTLNPGAAFMANWHIEAIAYQLRDVLEMMRTEAAVNLREIRADGGPTANALLMQFVSDIVGLELRVQEFLESPFSLRRNPVNSPHAAARHALAAHLGDEAGFGQLTNRVIERADVYIGKALDHCVAEAPLDLVRMQIAAMQHPQNE